MNSGNCPVATICNVSNEPLFDSTSQENVCLKVTCDSNADCEAPEICGLDRVCRTPVCQDDADCPGAEVCRAGACASPPSAADVASCEVVSGDRTLVEGSAVELVAVARDGTNTVLPGIAFNWSSSDEGIVAVSGATATGGANEGTATLTAQVEGGPSCSGEVQLQNTPALSANEVRVVVVTDGSNAPLAGATVVVDTGGDERRATTDAAGVAVFDGLTAAVSMTILAAGHDVVTLFEPGSADVFIPVPRVPDDSEAGGFRGVLDISTAAEGQILVGFAGPALPSNLLDFGLDSLVGDLIRTDIEINELELDFTGEEAPELPAGLLLGLNQNRITQDASRCLGATVGEGQLGCYLARAPEGRTAGWALGGRLKLQDVTPIISQISDVIGGDGDLPIGDLLVAGLPLVRNLNHAIEASLDISYSPKNSDGTADFAQYQSLDLQASQSLDVLSLVSVPDLPGDPGSCADAAVILGGVIMEGRGIVPLGVTAGLDSVDPASTPDCRIDGIVEPFGAGSADTQDGQMPLSLAPLHSGAEGSERFLLLAAANIDELFSADGIRVTAIVERTPTGVPANPSIDGPFLALPTGIVEGGAPSITLSSTVEGAVLNRYELQTPSLRWLVYAPSTRTDLVLPTLPELSEVAGNLTSAYILSLGLDGSYPEVFQTGSGKTLDRLIRTVTRFSIQQCAMTETAPCRLR